MYKLKFGRIILLLLMFRLLPACEGMPGLLPPPGSGVIQDAGEGLFQQAEDQYRRQDYRQAWQSYTTYQERYPQGPYARRVRLRRAELMGLRGDWGASLHAYQSLLAQQPDPDLALQARYGIGRAYFKLGQYQQATQVLENLTAENLPKSLRFSMQALLTEISLKQGQVAQAFSRLRLAAQDLSAGDQEWFEDLKTRLLDQATAAELEQLAALYRDTPLSATLLLGLARLAQKEGRVEDARTWLQTLKDRFPSSPEAKKAEGLLTPARRLLSCLLPLSGDFGAYGKRVKQGMELAAREAPVELAFRDTPNDSAGAAQLVRDSARDQRLLAILGPLGSKAAEGAAKAAQESGVTLIALSQRVGVTQAGDFVFQAFLTVRQQARALLRRALQQGLQRYAILYPDSPYGQTFRQAFQEEMAAQGGELVREEGYASGTQDFSPFLAALKAEDGGGFDALFLPDDAATVATIAGQLSGTPLEHVRLLGTNLIHSPNLRANQTRALEGILFTDAFFARDPAPVVQNFIASYQQQYGEAPDYLAAQGYAVVRRLAQILVQKNATRAELPRQLLSLHGGNLPWLQGFNTDREAELSLYVLTIRNGAVQLAPSSPKTSI